MSTPSPSDQRLFEGIRFGNEADFECFFRRYYPRLVNYAARFVAGHETARDLVQDSFARLWERRRELRELDLASLLFTMVRNACLNYLKHNGVAAAVAVVCAAFFGARLYDRLLLERATECYTVTTKSGDRSTVCLPDGTQVRLNGSSTLTYPANFNATNRSVELSGAAFFDVSPDEKHRFEVKVGNCSVVVKGTKFDVTAYPDDSLITTTLLEGAVGFTAPRGETALRPGESLTYDRFAETTAITHVNTAQYLAWIEGRIEFIDVTIVQLCESLSSLYGVEITLDDRLRADGTFITIRLSNQESLDSVLKALDLIVPVSIHRQGPSVRLSAK